MAEAYRGRGESPCLPSGQNWGERKQQAGVSAGRRGKSEAASCFEPRRTPS